MAAAKKPVQPIVVKRIKKGGHGHHGGAWKIAYADFVTAMMAFFLLMWLLGSTTSGDLKGISDYFNSPLKIAMAGGSGSGDSSSVLKGGGMDLTRSTGQVKNGDVEAKKRNVTTKALRAELAKRDEERFKSLLAKVEGTIANDARLKDFREQIRMDITKEGLRVQIVDDLNRPMFDIGKSQVKPYMRDILREIGRVLNEVDYRIMLSGHTDAAPYVSGERGYSNWELSADRANASRRELVTGGMDEAKIFRVVGVASSAPANVADPRDPANRRITIVVMNKLTEERMARSGHAVDIADADDLSDELSADAGKSTSLQATPAAAPVVAGNAVVAPIGAATTNGAK
jgi:chemotaxis protein MotB